MPFVWSCAKKVSDFSEYENLKETFLVVFSFGFQVHDFISVVDEIENSCFRWWHSVAFMTPVFVIP